jgi:hypothetical protein
MNVIETPCSQPSLPLLSDAAPTFTLRALRAFAAADHAAVHLLDQGPHKVTRHSSSRPLRDWRRRSAGVRVGVRQRGTMQRWEAVHVNEAARSYSAAICATLVQHGHSSLKRAAAEVAALRVQGVQGLGPALACSRAGF